MQRCTLLVVFVVVCSTFLSNLAPLSAANVATENVSITATGTVRPFIRFSSTGTLRSNFTGMAGMKITLGAESLSVTALGRLMNAGNRRSHVLKVVRATDLVELAAVTLDLATNAPVAGRFAYTNLSAPLLLSSNTAYYFVTTETNGGDSFRDINTTVSGEPVAIINSGVFKQPTSAWTLTSEMNHSYGPVDFLYEAAAPPPPPVANLIRPLEGDVFFRLTNIALEAEISGVITNVEFYRDSVKLGDDATSPYTFVWTNPPAGSFRLRARAQVADGSFITSKTVNITVLDPEPPSPPSIAITNPPNDSVFLEPPQIVLGVSASAGVTNVEFFRNGIALGSDNTAPFSFTWVFPPGGIHDLTARAIATNGLAATSAVVRVTIQTNAPTPPSIDLTNPPHNSVLVEPSEVLVAASASPGVTNVQFFRNGVFLGSDNTAPFSFTWAFPPVGVYDLTARAFATNGLGATSAVVRLTIQTNVSTNEISYVVSSNPSLLRNDVTGFLGMAFTVGSNSITVTRLGRLVAPGNTQSHALKLVRAADGVDLPGSGVTVNTAGAVSNTFVYAALPSPLVLHPGTTYFLASQETQGGDSWYDLERTTITTTGVATDNGGVYQLPGDGWVVGGLPGNSYIPVDFKYLPALSLPAVTTTIISPVQGRSFIRSAEVLIEAEASAGVTNVQFFANGLFLGEDSLAPFQLTWTGGALGDYALTTRALAQNGLGATSSVVNIAITTNVAGVETSYVVVKEPRILRNDFSGFLGMLFTVGSNSVTVTRLGRLVIEGNTQSHLVKLVRASDGLDVPGGSATVSTLGGVPEEFRYAPLASPVTLSPLTTYYLVSEEFHGGDFWYDGDRTKIRTTAVATNKNTIWGNNNVWNPASVPGHSYVPLDFKYLQDAGLPAVQVTLISPADGASFRQPTNVVIEAQVSAGVTNVSFFANNVFLGRRIAAPFSITWTNPALGNYVLQATAAASNGLTAASAPVTISITTNIAGVEAGFVLAKDPQLLRNDFTGYLGTIVRVGSNSITVTRLGRIFVPGNTNNHTMKIIRARDGVEIASAVVPIALGGLPDEFVYGTLASPVVLPPFEIFYLVSEESVGGDRWYDLERTTITTSPVAAAIGGVYGSPASGWVPGGLPGFSYGPLDFRYLADEGLPEVAAQIVQPINSSSFKVPTNVVIQAAVSEGVTNVEFFANNVRIGGVSSAPFNLVWTNPVVGDYGLSLRVRARNGLMATSDVVNISITTNFNGLEATFLVARNPQLPRNNFSGFLGMLIRVGPQPLSVTRLGRLFLAGNTGNHVVKLVRADDEQDVPGAAVIITSQNGVPDEFKYALLPQVVILEANTEYFLVSEEFAGGDQWYDLERTTVVPGAVGEVRGGVFSTVENPFVLGGLPGHSYGPLDFKYLVTAGSTNRAHLIAGRADGQLQVILFGEAGRRYAIEASSNLTQWTELGTVTLSGESLILPNTLLGTAAQRFYRAVLRP